MTIERPSLHPLHRIAAGAVTLASLTAAAHFAGFLPLTVKDEAAPVAVTTAASAPAATTVLNTASSPLPVRNSETPAVTAVQKSVAPTPKRPSPAAATTQVAAGQNPLPTRAPSPEAVAAAPAVPPPPQAAMPPGPMAVPAPGWASQAALCRECGTIQSIRELRSPGEGSGLGAIAGGLIGGVLGNQVGRGSGRDAATILATVSGAYAGHQIERSAHSTPRVEITVRFDDGSLRTFGQESASRWREGDRIRLYQGQLQPA